MTQPFRLTAIIEREDEGFVLFSALNSTLPVKALQSKRPERIWWKRFLYSSRRPIHLKSRGVSAAKSSLRRSRFLLGRLRVLSGNEVCRILERNGFVAVRQGGSHRIMQRQIEGTTITVSVPLHDTLKRGTLASIIRQSGLARAYFETGG